jgi:hypothetical protein
MKVRIAFTVEVDKKFRRALNAYYGKEGLATRKDVQQWYEQNASSVDADMVNQYDEECEREVKGGESS